MSTGSESSATPGSEAASALREAARLLLERAERLEAEAGQEAPAPEAEPLGAPASEQEASARLVALDLVTREVPRDEAVALLAERFPDVDGPALLERLGAAAP